MFVYDRLSQEDREIRLVSFCVPAAVCDDTINLTSSRVSPNYHPSYHALSYVWGGPTPTATVNLNNKSLPIGNNLQSALLHLRQNGVVSWFWVDAICIDQNNQEERNWQAAQMRDIFAQADLVHIWLGPCRDDSDLVLEMAQRIGPEALNAGVLGLWKDWPSQNSRVDTLPENAMDDKAL
ncbi:heterokaryon incompatibility protein [Colletotrichum incanum]|uniref:Heterokaryon incompatibility protein n=1 Tax=Colletotrichum incanum TaxID=1573173 RepID=A0A167BNQ7_COLIC|nr:heterokaryon incompatibility protein [Colletotrichum incanum]